MGRVTKERCWSWQNSTFPPYHHQTLGWRTAWKVTIHRHTIHIHFYTRTILLYFRSEREVRANYTYFHYDILVLDRPLCQSLVFPRCFLSYSKTSFAFNHTEAFTNIYQDIVDVNCNLWSEKNRIFGIDRSIQKYSPSETWKKMVIQNNKS